MFKEELITQYFNEKDVAKRHQLLKEIMFKCEYVSKDFFEKAFKKERKLEEKLTALRGFAYYASEEEVKFLSEKIFNSLIKIPQTTPYAYNLYEEIRAAYLLPYLVKTYKYPCLIKLRDQVEKQYNDMPDVFKNIYSFDEFGVFYEIRDPKEVKESIDAFFKRKKPI